MAARGGSSGCLPGSPIRKAAGRPGPGEAEGRVSRQVHIKVIHAQGACLL